MSQATQAQTQVAAKQVKKKVVATPALETTSAEPKPIARSTARSAKPKTKKEIHVVASVSATGEITGSLQPMIKRPLIAHLPISSSSVTFTDAPPEYNPNLPDPKAANEMVGDPFMMSTEELYEPMEGSHDELDDDITKMKEELKTHLSPDMVTENRLLCEKMSSESMNAQSPAATSTLPANTPHKKKEIPPVTPYHTNVKLFAEFATKGGTVPDQVVTSCFWCCHGFDWKPVVIPSRYENPQDKVQGIYKVYGNFCTPECGMAYLLNEHIDMNSRWERISWIHHIYCSGEMQRIYPAPARETLTMFGGVYDIEEFRDLALSRKLRADVNYPPMVSLLATMDTKPIDFYEGSTKQSGGLLGVGSGLRLKRSKPLKEIENTLDGCLNIQIRQ
jgi:hypothetical protein